MDKKVFGNRYQITERIGVGGMAEVFKATDSTLGRTVALKVMLPQYASDRTFAARFRQEAQAAANLTSPYIVNIYDWGRDDDMYYIIMEYVRGTDLKTAVQDRGAIHPRKVAEIGSQVCSALSVAHSYGIIHRDIKSANIMVQTDGNVKVMDFGIAQAGNCDMTQDSNVLGTAHYVSPEQAQGKPLAGTSDLYSLGVVMFEAATGQLPFDGPDAVSVAMKQVSEEPVEPRVINADIDPALQAIILKAMAKDVRDRFQTANEMKQALDDYLAGRGSNAATTVIGAAAAGAAAASGLGATRVIDPIEAQDGANNAGRVNDAYGSSKGKAASGKGKKAPLKIIIPIVIVLIIAAVIGGMVLGSGSQEEQVIVPNVTDSTLAEATTTLEGYGLSVGNVTYSASETVDKDKIITQDPAANSSIDAGGKVNIVISTGKEEGEQTSVPNLLGLTEEQAAQALDDAGFVYKKLTGYSDDYASGKVFEQTPSAMSQAAKGSEVTFRVSLGKADTQVKIGNYVGQNADDVKSELESQGLKVTLSYEYNESVGEGDIFEQSVSSGESLSEGGAITFKVSKGSKPQETTSVPSTLGMTESKAKSAIKNAGFQVSVSYDEGEDGVVISQSPSSGTAKSGATISIVVGTGTSDSSSSDTDDSSSN